MTITTDFGKWARGFSGCDGGDIGSHEKQSIWYCGIEWGGGWHEKMLEDEDFFVDGTESPLVVTLSGKKIYHIALIGKQ